MRSFAAVLKYYLYTIFLLLLSAFIRAQLPNDLLEIKHLSKNLKPEQYNDSLYKIARKYKDKNGIVAIKLYTELIKKSKQTNQHNLVLLSINSIGLIKAEQNKLADAYRCHQEAYSLACSLKDSANMASSLLYIGDTYKRLRLQEKGLDYVNRALQIARLIKDSNEIQKFSNMVGHINIDRAEETNVFQYYTNALNAYKFSLHINEKRKDTANHCNSYINLANAYIVMFKHSGDKSFLRQSIKHSLAGRSLTQNTKYVQEWSLCTMNLGEAYYNLGDFDQAITLFEICLENYKKQNKQLWQAATFVDLALAYEKKQNYDKALNLIKEANRITVEYDQVEPFVNYKYLADLYAQKKDYKAAYEASDKYHELLNREMNMRSMLEVEGKQLELDIARKDKEIELLNKENKYNAEQHKKDIIINYVLIGLSLLMAIVLVLLINRTRILKKSKENSDRARIMQQQFLANTSHEIRTPMNGIIGMANELEHSGLTQEQKITLQVIKKSANSLLSIINDVLDLSKIQAGRVDFKQKTFLLDVLLDEVQKLMLSQASQKGLRLSFIIDDKLPEVLLGDELRLKQILINLLSNAIKFTAEGSVSLNVSCDKRVDAFYFIKFEVIDTGVGIPLKKQDEIFENFVQLEDSGTRTFGGTGLGLSISKSLIELQGGTINVKSKPKEGSTFEVIIPFESQTLETYINECAKTEAALSLERNLSGIIILIVEDNIINQQVLAKILDRWNVEYFIASTAVEGFALLSEHKFDLILMDIEMPGINGWEATQYIRTKFSEPIKSLPVLALTAYAYDSEREKSIQSGMNDVLIKPYGEEELYLKIRELLFGEKYAAPVKSKNNVEELELRYSNDPEGLKDLYKLFIQEMPEYINEFKNAYLKGDVTELSKLAHKMKSPISLIGNKETIESLRILNANKELAGELRTKLVENILLECEDLMMTVKNKLRKL